MKCGRLGASSVCTIQPCTRLQCHFIRSDIGRVYACLAVTCHLRFWQNDRDLLRATAVTRGWNGYRKVMPLPWRLWVQSKDSPERRSPTPWLLFTTIVTALPPPTGGCYSDQTIVCCFLLGNQKVCKIDLYVRGVVGQAVQSTAVVTV